MGIAPGLNTHQKKEQSGAPFAAGAANNGLSVDSSTGKIVLGNDSGDGLLPAELISDREIPFGAGSKSIFFFNNAGGNVDTFSIFAPANGVVNQNIALVFNDPVNGWGYGVQMDPSSGALLIGGPPFGFGQRVDDYVSFNYNLRPGFSLRESLSSIATSSLMSVSTSINGDIATFKSEATDGLTAAAVQILDSTNRIASVLSLNTQGSFFQVGAYDIHSSPNIALSAGMLADNSTPKMVFVNVSNAIFGTFYFSWLNSNVTTGDTELMRLDNSGLTLKDVSGNSYIVPKTLQASASLSWPAGIPANAEVDNTIPVPGAALNDVVSTGIPASSLAAGGTFFSFVSAGDTITVRYINTTGAAASPASGTFKISVTKF